MSTIPNNLFAPTSTEKIMNKAGSMDTYCTPAVPTSKQLPSILLSSRKSNPLPNSTPNRVKLSPRKIEYDTETSEIIFTTQKESIQSSTSMALAERFENTNSINVNDETSKNEDEHGTMITLDNLTEKYLSEHKKLNSNSTNPVQVCKIEELQILNVNQDELAHTNTSLTAQYSSLPNQYIQSQSYSSSRLSTAHLKYAPVDSATFYEPYKCASSSIGGYRPTSASGSLVSTYSPTYYPYIVRLNLTILP